MTDEQELVRRAHAAFKRAGGVDIPSNDSGIESAGGKDYVVLRNIRGVMAVYMIQSDGSLKGMKEVPEGILQ